MLNRQYTTVRNLPLSEISNPKHLEALLEYAGELAPPCVAEGIMNSLNRAPRKLSLLVDADLDVLIRKRADELRISSRRVIEELLFKEFEAELTRPLNKVTDVQAG